MFSLIRVAIMFLLGNFYISVLDRHINKLNDFEIVGYKFGGGFVEVIQSNKLTILVTMMALTNFII